jgi:hypothetical protein
MITASKVAAILLAAIVIIGMATVWTGVQVVHAQDGPSCHSIEGVSALCEGPDIRGESQIANALADKETSGEIGMADNFVARPCPLPIDGGVICSGPDPVDEESSNTSGNSPVQLDQFAFLPVISN